VENAIVIIFVGLLVFLAHFFVALFERTRVPDVLYLVLIGVIIGPILRIISPQDFGNVGHIFTTIALVVILFEGGLELSIESLKTSVRGTMIITIISFVLTWITLTPLIYLILKLSFSLSLFTAAVLAGPAPAVVIPLVRQLRMSESTRTVMMLESPLGEALSIIISLAILDSISYNEINIGHTIGKLLSSFLFAVIIGTIGGYAWSILLHRMRQLRFAIFTTPSFLFIIYGCAEIFGFSGPVTALVFGITLGNAGIKEVPWLVRIFHLTPLVHNETERQFFGEIVFLIKTFFFVYVGLSTQFAELITVYYAFIITCVILVVRLFAMRLSALYDGTPREDHALMGIIIPKGTAAAVLASIPFQKGLTGGNTIQNFIYSVIIVSIILTAIIISQMEKPNILRLLRTIVGNEKRTEINPEKNSDIE
jgi:NhaP-type Na+/H+ or K+/H+ antiporter